jgi:uncharacterized membrane protein
MPERVNSHSQQDSRQLAPEEEQVLWLLNRERKRTGTKVSSKSFIWMIVAWTILAIFAGFYILFQLPVLYILKYGGAEYRYILIIFLIVYVLGLALAFSIKRPKKK